MNEQEISDYLKVFGNALLGQAQNLKELSFEFDVLKKDVNDLRLLILKEGATYKKQSDGKKTIGSKVKKFFEPRGNEEAVLESLKGL